MIRPWLIGKKVYLRALERSDVRAGWHDWINDSVATEGLLGSNPMTLEEVEAYYDSAVSSPAVIMFAVCDQQTDTYIGNARLSAIDYIQRSAVYGRLIGRSDYRGRGYGSDALIQLLRHGFHNLGLNRIWSVASSHNRASLASNAKVGMRDEGIARQACFRNGAFIDGIHLGILREDFDALHGDPDAWKAHDAAIMRETANLASSAA